MTQRIKATLNGASYTNVTWSLNPLLGTITSDGFYTAPDTVDRDTSITVTAVSKDDVRKSSIDRFPPQSTT